VAGTNAQEVLADRSASGIPPPPGPADDDDFATMDVGPSRGNGHFTLAQAPAAFAAPKAAGRARHADFVRAAGGASGRRGQDAGACVACHKPVQGDSACRFAAALHRAHAGGDCVMCHARAARGAIAVVAGGSAAGDSGGTRR
jgi:hypothetical protein